MKKHNRFNLTLFKAINKLGKIKIALRGFVSYLPNVEKRLDVIFKKNRLEVKKSCASKTAKKKKVKIKRGGRLLINLSPKRPFSEPALSSQHRYAHK